jgi:hypothetical protein
MLRFAAGITAFVAVFHCVLLFLVAVKDGWNTSAILAKPFAAALPFFFFDTYILGLLYFRLRDAMCGAPWARKSAPLAIGLVALIALVTFCSALAFNVLVSLDPAHAARGLYLTMGMAAVAAAIFPIVAGINGPEQISDAVWAGLDLDESKPEVD